MGWVDVPFTFRVNNAPVAGNEDRVSLGQTKMCNQANK